MQVFVSTSQWINCLHQVWFRHSSEHCKMCHVGTQESIHEKRTENVNKWNDSSHETGMKSRNGQGTSRSPCYMNLGIRKRREAIKSELNTFTRCWGRLVLRICADVMRTNDVWWNEAEFRPSKDVRGNLGITGRPFRNTTFITGTDMKCYKATRLQCFLRLVCALVA